MLLGRDPAASVSLDAPVGVARLLFALREAGAQDQVTALADRAADVPLDDPGAVAWLLETLLDTLWELGAGKQAAALAVRRRNVPLDDPGAVAMLLDTLHAADAQERLTALTEWISAAGMFMLFLEQADNLDRFRFGREADGSPAKPWGWNDLDDGSRVSVRGPANGHPADWHDPGR